MQAHDTPTQGCSQAKKGRRAIEIFDDVLNR